MIAMNTGLDSPLQDLYAVMLIIVRGPVFVEMPCVATERPPVTS